MNKVLQAALNFHDAGVCVVPSRVDGSKAPLGLWKQYQSTMPTIDEITAWFTLPQATGIGIICGAVSGNLEMLELEGRAVQSKLHIEARDIAEASGLGELWVKVSSGYVEQTPSGGIHWLYRIADAQVPGNTKLARRPGENGGVDVLAETRGEGGFVITAPSSGGVHPSGNPWVMVTGSAATIPTITWEEREAIHAIFRALDEMPVKEEVVRDLVKESTSDKPGDDFNERAQWDDILIGWKKIFSAGGVTYWRRPGKDTGISATTGRNDGDNLFVFTTSTSFEAEKPYSKFAAFAHLNHGDNFSAAASALRAMGYGKVPDSSLSLLSQPSAPLLEIVPAPEEGEESSWKPISLEQFFDGSYVKPETTIFYRNDAKAMIYPGRVHSFYGESESGKSWLAQIVVAEQLKAFKKVIYIDFEADAADLIDRLQSLGVSQAEILQNFTYIKPEAAKNHEDPHWQAILDSKATLVIIDGVTEALTMWGGETKDNDAITKWMRLFPRAISRCGAAVITIDHVTKDRETRGRFAIGGQAKLATIDGAAFLIEPLEALAPGRTGTLTVRITKDRPGAVRAIAGIYRKSDRTQEVAVVTIDSTRPVMQWVIAPPILEEEMEKMATDKLNRDILEFVAGNPSSAKSKVVRGVKGHTDNVVLARIDGLISEGMLRNDGNARSYILNVTESGKSHIGHSDALIFKISGDM